MNKKQNYERLKLEVERREAAVAEERRIFDKANPQTREIHRLRRAEDVLSAARINLREAERVWQREEAAMAAEEERLALTAPPSLQALVEAHGTYDKITPEAWAAFDREMKLWKDKVRFGEFPPRRWIPPAPEGAGG